MYAYVYIYIYIHRIMMMIAFIIALRENHVLIAFGTLFAIDPTHVELEACML